MVESIYYSNTFLLYQCICSDELDLSENLKKKIHRDLMITHFV